MNGHGPERNPQGKVTQTSAHGRHSRKTIQTTDNMFAHTTHSKDVYIANNQKQK